MQGLAYVFSQLAEKCFPGDFTGPHANEVPGVHLAVNHPDTACIGISRKRNQGALG